MFIALDAYECLKLKNKLEAIRRVPRGPSLKFEKSGVKVKLAYQKCFKVCISASTITVITPGWFGDLEVH
jgi:hypothetical protein